MKLNEEDLNSSVIHRNNVSILLIWQHLMSLKDEEVLSFLKML